MSALPKDWVMTRFADVADYRAGRTPARANKAFWSEGPTGVPWVAISDMTNHGVIQETSERITQKAFEEVFRGRVVPAGTLIMSFKLTIGRVAVLGIDACHNEAIIAIYPRKGIDQRFLGYALSEVDYGGLQDRQIKGNTLNQEKIDRIPIAIPPVPEQRAIADTLDLIRAAVKLESEVLDTALSLKRSVMRSLFRLGRGGELREVEDQTSLPEGWSSVRLDQCANVVSTRMQYSELEAQQDSAQQDAVRVLGIKVSDMNTTGNEIVIRSAALERRMPLALAQHRCAPPGTIVFPKRGAAIATNKKRQVADWVVFDPNLIGVVAMPGLDQKFLFHWFQQFDLRTITEPGPTPQLNKKDLVPLLIPVPSDETEQRQIAAVLDAIDCKVTLHKARRVVLESLFRSLLRRLTTGELRVGDLNLDALGRASKSAAA